MCNIKGQNDEVFLVKYRPVCIKMSSKLIKKSLELVCSDSTGQKNTANNSKNRLNTQISDPRGIKAKKVNKTRKDRKRKLERNKKKRKEKLRDQIKKDFTKQNLEYLTNTSWKMEQSVYETIIKRSGKKLEVSVP